MHRCLRKCIIESETTLTAIDGVILPVFGHSEIAVDFQARVMHGLQGGTATYFDETRPHISLLRRSSNCEEDGQ
jgi:hypothetical protein